MGPCFPKRTVMDSKKKKADGENVGKQDRKEKDKGHDGDETT